MFVYECFDGDDLEVAWAQHDLYFGRDIPLSHTIAGRFYTLGWWWQVLLTQAEQRRLWLPWVDRHYHRLQRVGPFSHKLLQLPHEHIAAFYRWQVRRQPELSDHPLDESTRRLRHLAAWRDWAQGELEDLMDSDDTVLSMAKLILYRQFDASDRAAEELDRILVQRYGMECVAKTWRNRDPVMLAARCTRAGSRPDPAVGAY